MILYHGSNVAVAKPNLDLSRKTLDFGLGFYTTTHRKQAMTFAAIVHNRKGGKKIISQYNFDNDKAFLKLKIKTFEKADEQWLDFVVANRNGEYTGEKYDIIQGPVANDKVFKQSFFIQEGSCQNRRHQKRLNHLSYMIKLFLKQQKH
jgi:hypothetical protein